MSEERDTLLDRRRLKKKLTYWQIGALVLVLIAAAAVFSNFSSSSQPHIARITIAGTILEDREREKLLARVARDTNAKAVLIRINSPGGTVGGSEALYKGLRAIAEDRPAASYISTIGASGGYMAAMAADKIYSQQTSIVGSIGVIMRIPEFSEAFDHIGVSIQDVKSDDLKGGPRIDSPLTDDQRAELQQLVDDTYGWFLNLVIDRRSMEAEEARLVADGRVYSGQRSLELGLVDELATEKDAIAWLREQEGVGVTLPVIDVRKPEFDNIFSQAMAWIGLEDALSSTLALDGLLALWQPN